MDNVEFHHRRFDRIKTWIEKLLFRIGWLRVTVIPREDAQSLTGNDDIWTRVIKTSHGFFILRIKKVTDRRKRSKGRQLYIVEIDPPEDLTIRSDIDHIGDNCVVILRVSYITLGMRVIARLLANIYVERLLDDIRQNEEQD